MSVAAAACIDTAAEFLAAQPGAVERALRTHRAGGNGRCRACGGVAARWPCATAASALRARELLA